jgi:outer membrane lipoprotein-sorting protein
MYSMRCFRITYIFSIPLCLFVIAGSVRAEKTLSLFRELVKESARINTIDAEIEQHIKAPDESIELFKGRYRADNMGRFRIDYHIPYHQIVVHNGRVLNWYYPDDNLLYTFGEDGGPVENPGMNPLREFSKRLNNVIEVNYLGRNLYGFLILAHHFSILVKDRDVIIDLWIDVKRKVVLSKTVLNRAGQEMLKEVYGGHERIGGIYFHLRVDVYARTNKGITRNTTYYKNVRLNRRLKGDIFFISLPKDVKIKHYRK